MSQHRRQSWIDSSVTPPLAGDLQVGAPLSQAATSKNQARVARKIEDATINRECMVSAESIGDAGEYPRNVNRVTLDVLGAQVDFLVVHSIHFLTTTKTEVAQANALFLEGLLLPQHRGKFNFESLVHSHPYRRLAEVATAAENPLPVIAIDLELGNQDIVQIGKESVVALGGLAGGVWLIERSIIDARKKLTRRAVLQGAVGAPLLLEPVAALVSMLADYRARSLSGKVATTLSALQDHNPFGMKTLVALRNRVFAYKSLLAAKVLIQGLPNDDVWKGLSHHGPPLRFPLVVGSAHADVARQLRRDPIALWHEIVELSRAVGASGTLLSSAGTVQMAKYDPRAARWNIINVRHRATGASSD